MYLSKFEMRVNKIILWKDSTTNYVLIIRWRFQKLESLKAIKVMFIIYSLFNESEKSERRYKTEWQSHVTIKYKRAVLLIWRRNQTPFKFVTKSETQTILELPNYLRPPCSQNPSKLDRCRTTTVMMMMMMHSFPV